MTVPEELSVIRPAIFSGRPEVIAALSTRSGGVSPFPYGMNLSFVVGDNAENVRRNRELFFGGLGIDEGELAVPRQVHSPAVRFVHTPGVYENCDGLITRSARVFLCITVADCVPVLLYDPVTGVTAAVHAGWRGTVAGIVKRAVDMLRKECSVRPPDLLAYLGPSAGKCCYEVGEDVARGFDAAFVDRSGGTTRVDLRGANAVQLEAAGVRDIEMGPGCTIEGSDRFHSYRRDGSRSGRMMAVIGQNGPSS